MTRKKSSFDRLSKKGDKSTARVPQKSKFDPSSLIFTPPEVKKSFTKSKSDDIDINIPIQLSVPYLIQASLYASCICPDIKREIDSESVVTKVFKPSPLPQLAVFEVMDSSEISSLTFSSKKVNLNASDSIYSIENFVDAIENLTQYIKLLPADDRNSIFQILKDKINSVETYLAMKANTCNILSKYDVDLNNTSSNS